MKVRGTVEFRDVEMGVWVLIGEDGRTYQLEASATLSTGEILNRNVPVRCFNLDPSISSSLKFLRKTPWAREQVEQLYVQTQRADELEQQRRARRSERSED